MSLRRRTRLRLDLEEHTRSGRHAIVSFSRRGAESLDALGARASRILPFESHDTLPATGDAFVFAGSIDYENKVVSSLLDACATLPPGESLVVLGGTRNARFAEDPHIRRLLDDLAARGVEDKIRFTGYLPYDEFVERLRRSRFLVPLVDDRIANGDYLTRMPAAIPLSLGLGVPMIVNEAIAREYGLDFMVCYQGEDLASGLATARSLSDEDYARLRKRTREAARWQKKHNLDTLAGILRRIVP